MNRCNEKRHTHVSFFAGAARAAREIGRTSRARADAPADRFVPSARA